ncbi:hypothetical protein ZIOFF_058304 [Zingiber officinale]|uniref:Protein kinase domain-containing protein n=1 Tax=Zingiber officinale TaxID=94328 RepID=A0A8J5FAZ7_ZINOF|nr:hypothetical protein ZIOFF_058304 [Zingiber officinale]
MAGGRSNGLESTKSGVCYEPTKPDPQTFQLLLRDCPLLGLLSAVLRLVRTTTRRPLPPQFSIGRLPCFVFLSASFGVGAASSFENGSQRGAKRASVGDRGRMGRNGSVKRSYSASPNDYKLLEEVGYGASATVYRAIYLPSNEFVAVKRLDLDRCNSNLDDIRREAQTMSLIDHPNVIRAYCSFVVEQYLWVVMPFMAGGSCLHLMKIAYPDGFEEPVICSILKETLKALEYLHRHGHIHRDVKAGNILLDSSGVVKLGDFGVSACMFDKCDRQRSRNTFVGTPCWMAPEVLQPGSGYDFKADIWSFGITALELAHGHAPFSKYPPMKVLLMTLQNAPPGLDYDRDKKFSKSFKEMIAMCLVKDQTKRPTAEKLLKHSLFKHAKPPEILLKSILSDLPPLWDCVKALQLKDAAQLVLKKMPSSEQEALSQIQCHNYGLSNILILRSVTQLKRDIVEVSQKHILMVLLYQMPPHKLPFPRPWSFQQCDLFMEQEIAFVFVGMKRCRGVAQLRECQMNDLIAIGKRRDIQFKGCATTGGSHHSEYQRGVSAWNFDIEDLKAQASLIQDDDDLSEMKEDEETIKNFVSSKDPSTPRSSCEKSPINDKTNSRGSIPCAESLETKCSNTRDEILQAESSDASNQERLDQYDSRRLKGDLAPSTSKPDALTNHRKVEVGKRCQTYSGPLALSGMPTTSVSERVHSAERVDNDNQQGAERYIRDTRKVANLSGPLMLPNRASANSLSAPMRSSTGCGDSLEDKIKPNVVQIKGRFSVTSENVDLVKDLPLCNISRRSTQESPLRKSASVGDWVINPKPVVLVFLYFQSLGQPPNGDGNNNLKEVKPPNGDGNNNMKEVKPPNGDGNNNMKEVNNSTVPAHILKPHLENLFQQTSFQQDLIMNLLNSLQQRETIDLPYLTQNVRNENLLDAVNSERERILLIKISELQARMITLTDELTAAKLQHIQASETYIAEEITILDFRKMLRVAFLDKGQFLFVPLKLTIISDPDLVYKSNGKELTEISISQFSQWHIAWIVGRSYFTTSVAGMLGVYLYLHRAARLLFLGSGSLMLWLSTSVEAQILHLQSDLHAETLAKEKWALELAEAKRPEMKI